MALLLFSPIFFFFDGKVLKKDRERELMSAASVDGDPLSSYPPVSKPGHKMVQQQTCVDMPVLSPSTQQGVSEGFQPLTTQQSANASSLLSISTQSSGSVQVGLIPPQGDGEEQEAHVEPTAEGFIALTNQRSMTTQETSGRSSSSQMHS